MEVLSINQQVRILRSDGRIHKAGIIKLDAVNRNMVTVEWSEDNTVRGKTITLQKIIKLNPQLYEEIPSNQIMNRSDSAPMSNLMVTIKPRSSGRTIDSNSSDGAATYIEYQSAAVRRVNRRRLAAGARMYLDWSRREHPSNPNWDLARVIRLERIQMSFQPRGPPVVNTDNHKIMVCVRKRPLNKKEHDAIETDIISIPNTELLVIHEPRRRVNLTRYLQNHAYRFDHVFDELSTNVLVYEQTARPLVQHIFNGGMATCFAYGQTGSGKTHTMSGAVTSNQHRDQFGIYAMAANDVFTYLSQSKYEHLKLTVYCSFFELYASKVCDLLKPGKPALRVLEDGQQQVQVVGLSENHVTNTDEVLALLELGNSVRASGQTSANSKSSRSHAVFQIILRSEVLNELHGKFSLIDLAGNERGADSCTADRTTRLEGGDINKSLLALKECIRAIGRNAVHIPFRGSKLTQVLRDSFIPGKNVKTCMIATISPGYKCVEHTLNTVRYANRVKELPLLNSNRNMTVTHSNSLPEIGSQAAVRSQTAVRSQAAVRTRASSAVSLFESEFRATTAD